MLVDGYLIRNTIDTDFNIIHRHGTDIDCFSPKFYIPEDEVWIDHRYADEADFLIAADRIVEKIHAGSRTELIRKLREMGILKQGPPPLFVGRKEIHGPLIICFVDGKIVREYIDSEFVLGGHDLVYQYIPKNEVWIDAKIEPREIPFIVAHEVEERTRMEKEHLSYGIAHEYATVIERALRRKHDNVDFPGEPGFPLSHLSPQEIIQRFYVAERLHQKRPVVVTHCEQSPNMCGPAALKIALSAFGKHMTEEELAAHSSATIEYGTEHEGLVRAAKECGATVIEREGGTLAEIEHLVKEKHLPVIVGWFDKDDDHYAIVVDVTPEYLILADPSWHRPERFVRREHFDNIWFDFVGKDNARTSWRWYMAINFPPPSEGRG